MHKNENILKINDENDETFDRDMNVTGDWFTTSKGFSMRTTPKKGIAYKAEDSETARIRRAYIKHSDNIADWNKTINNFNMKRKTSQSKVKSPIRTLVQLQDSYQEAHLPARLREHIEDELSALETSRSKNMQVGLVTEDTIASMPFIIGQPSASDFIDSVISCDRSNMTQGEKRYLMRKKYGERFDNREADAKFYQDLRGSNLKFTQTNIKNPFQSCWSTEPTKRLDRVQKLKEINFMKRSGFNKHIDDMSKMKMIDQPISEKKLNARTLRKNTTKNLISIMKDTGGKDSPSKTSEGSELNTSRFELN